MIRARMRWVVLALAAALPLTGAEPTEEMRAKTRDLYLKYSQVPAGQDSLSLKAAAEELLTLPMRRAATQPVPAAATTPPASGSAQAPTVQGSAVVAALPPAPHELDAAAIKALAAAPGADLSLLVAIADGLFMEARLANAAAIYEIVTNQPGEPETLAWATYQLGNCRRKLAPESAVKLYDKVRQEAGDCPWRDAAEASFHLLEWMQAQQLPTLLGVNELAKPAGPAAGPVKEQE